MVDLGASCAVRRGACGRGVEEARRRGIAFAHGLFITSTTLDGDVGAMPVFVVACYLVKAPSRPGDLNAG
jgi:hypothetical protein